MGSYMLLYNCKRAVNLWLEDMLTTHMTYSLEWEKRYTAADHLGMYNDDSPEMVLSLIHI